MTTTKTLCRTGSLPDFLFLYQYLGRRPLKHGCADIHGNNCVPNNLLTGDDVHSLTVTEAVIILVGTGRPPMRSRHPSRSLTMRGGPGPSRCRSMAIDPGSSKKCEVLLDGPRPGLQLPPPGVSARSAMELGK